MTAVSEDVRVTVAVVAVGSNALARMRWRRWGRGRMAAAVSLSRSGWVGVVLIPDTVAGMKAYRSRL